MPADYLADLSDFHVVGTVHIRAGRGLHQQVAETEWLERMHERFCLPSVTVGHVSFIQPDCAEVLAGHARSKPMHGIRSRPTTSPGPTVSVAGAPGTMQDDHWPRNFALLEKHRMSWDMRIPYWHLAEGAEGARSHLRTGAHRLRQQPAGRQPEHDVPWDRRCHARDLGARDTGDAAEVLRRQRHPLLSHPARSRLRKASLQTARPAIPCPPG